MSATLSQPRHRLIPADMAPEAVVAIIDTREQLPLDLSPLQATAGTLATGDYSVVGLVDVVAIERKGLGDLLGCVGTERRRFEREVQRLLAYPVRALVIEASWQDLEQGEWRAKVTPAAVVGSVLGWIAAGLPVILAGDHERAGRYVSRLLYTAARRRWREARQLCQSVSAFRERVAADEAAANTPPGGLKILPTQPPGHRLTAAAVN